MTTEITDRNKAAGYVCPSCRIVFSTFPHLHGNGVICPGCESLLKIPSLTEKVKEIALIKKSHRDTQVAQTTAYVLPENEHVSESQSDQTYAGGEYSLKLIIPLLILSMITLGGVGYMFLRPTNAPQTAIMDGNRVVSLVPESVAESSEGQLVEKVTKKTDGKYVFDPDSADQVARIETFIKKWYTAGSIDEMLELVNPAERIKEKMTKYYKRYPLVVSEVKSITSLVALKNDNVSDSYVTFTCETQDYKQRIGALKVTKDKVLLDWESYVCYNEMTWAELAESKPTDPVTVRVVAKRGHYYNNAFADERKWQAVILENPNETDEVLYGYVVRDSADDQLIFNFGNSDNQAFILEIHYMPNAEHGNQVIIGGIVNNSWLLN